MPTWNQHIFDEFVILPDAILADLEARANDIDELLHTLDFGDDMSLDDAYTDEFIDEDTDFDPFIADYADSSEEEEPIAANYDPFNPDTWNIQQILDFKDEIRHENALRLLEGLPLYDLYPGPDGRPVLL